MFGGYNETIGSGLPSSSFEEAASKIIRRPGRRALILGAQGALGSRLGAAFSAAGWEVVGAGRRAVIRPGFRTLDIRDPQRVRTAIEGFDVIVNTIPDPELVAERAALRHGGLVINVSAMPIGPGLRLRRETVDPQGAVVMGAGIAPGITNLLVADLILAYPRADEIELVFTVSTKAAAGSAGGDFAHRGATACRRHRTKTIPLPQPFGRRRCLGFAEPDAGWLGEAAGDRTVSPYICIAERGVHGGLLALNSIGVISRLPRSAFGPSAGERRAASCEPVAHWVAVLNRGERLAVRTVECRGDYEAAAQSTMLFADALLANGEGAPPSLGVFTPDELLSLHRLAPELSAAGIEVIARRPGGDTVPVLAPPRTIATLEGPYG